MELRELRIERLPGLDRPFTVTGAPGLNLLLGPNGSGKSSICRAVLGLLWPGTQDAGILDATWTDRDRTWFSARAGGPAVVWQRDGQVTAAPDLPLVDHAGAFRLGVLDLLKFSADATDGELARAIRNQMAGGYDLGALLERHPESMAGVGPAARTLQTARDRVRVLRHRQSDLANQESRLAALKRDRDAAQDASRRADALAAALEVVQARAAAEDAGRELEVRYNPAMARLQDTDFERLQTLRDRQRNFTRDRDEARRAAAAAESALKDARLPDGGPDGPVVAEARNRLDEARALAGDRDRAAAEVAAADEALETARAQVTPWGEPEPGAPLDASALRRAGRDLQEHLALRAERTAIDRLLNRSDLQDHDAGGPTVETLDAARRALSAWLAADGERLLPWPGLVASAGLLVGAVGLTFWKGGWPGWLLAGLAPAVLVVACWPPLMRSRTRRARSAFEATGVPAPATWTGGAVAARLEELDSEAPLTALTALRAQLRRDLAAGRDRAATELDSRQGPDDAGEATDAAERLLRSSAYHQALQDRDAAVARRDHLAAERDERVAAAVALLGPWLDAAPADVAALSAALDDLDLRRQAHRDAARELEDARTRGDDKDAGRRETEAEISALMTSQDLGPDEDAILHARVTQLAGFRQLEKVVTEKTAALALAESALGRLPADREDAARRALDRPAAELADELATARDEARSAAELTEQIIAIETRLDSAGRDTALNAAMVDLESARRDLAAIRDDRRDAALQRLLLERVRGSHRRASEPPVLARARRLFLDFTDGRLDLTVPESDSESFRAVDTATGGGLSLRQLSDGTRAQLLLAVRLAYLQETERGVRVPLFLDESLTASDAVRFEAIGRAMIRLIRDEDRQVFYLTCDPADVRAWQQLLEAEGLAEAPVIDLAQVRRLAAAAPADRRRDPSRGPIPEPAADETAASYGARIAAPALDAAAPAEAAHLIHLLPDRLPLLHALLARGIDRAGQIAPMADVLIADGALDDADRRLLAARGRALAGFTAAFAAGRGRTVPPGAITGGSGITSGKLPEIEAAAADLGGDAARLIDALAHKKVKGLRTSTREELAEWLQEAGYLDPRPVLERGQVMVEVKVSARADIEAGALDLPTLDTLLETWWIAAGGEVG